MRTTLNIDDDVARQLAALSRDQGRSVSRVANELMRHGLRTHSERPTAIPYDPPALDTGAPLVDVTDVAEALGRTDGSG
jgi:hypothetical protein